jgi:hypothetical protein
MSFLRQALRVSLQVPDAEFAIVHDNEWMSVVKPVRLLFNYFIACLTVFRKRRTTSPRTKKFWKDCVKNIVFAPLEMAVSAVECSSRNLNLNLHRMCISLTE